MIRYTHICSGASRFEDSKKPADLRKMHFPAGWQSDRRSETCPDCGDDAPLRGAYQVVSVLDN